MLKIRAQNPDLVIPANYYNEYVLLARTMQQQRVRPKGIYSVLGGAASSYKFVKEFPEAAQYIMDCNHWFDPKNPKALALKKKIEAKGEFYTYEVYMNYSCVLLLADALERAASADRAKIIGALESSTFAGHVMPYGPTKFVNGQNQGAAPVNTQVIDNDIQVIFPAAFASAKPVFPMPRGLTRPAARTAPPSCPSTMLSPVILVPAVLNGLMTGAVYALIALGLTLIYGVLHIINFAHGALLTAAMFAAFFAHKLLGPRSLRRGARAHAAVLPAGLWPAALRHRSGRARRGPQHPAGDARPRGRDRERAALRVPRRHPHHQPALRLRRR